MSRIEISVFLEKGKGGLDEHQMQKLLSVRQELEWAITGEGNVRVNVEALFSADDVVGVKKYADRVRCAHDGCPRCAENEASGLAALFG